LKKAKQDVTKLETKGENEKNERKKV